MMRLYGLLILRRIKYTYQLNANAVFEETKHESERQYEQQYLQLLQRFRSRLSKVKFIRSDANTPLMAATS